MPEPLLASLQIMGGLVLLVFAGEILVRGASSMAQLFRMSPLMIGLTVVSFGTSAPELAVSLKAIYSNSDALAVGNVVGSNIFNILFVLGGSALIVPLLVDSQLIRRDVPIMIVASLLLMYFANDGRLTRIEGGILFLMLVVYLAWCFFQSKKEPQSVQDEFSGNWPGDLFSWKKFLVSAGLVIAGIGLLALGANLLIRGAVWTAISLGVSELVVGLTVIAIGTSLPEAVTSLVAAYRGERDIAVGNVVGSNIFNILAVLGLSGLLAPRSIPIPIEAIGFDIPVMVAVAFACFPIFATGNLIRRWEGGLFFFYLFLYLAFVVLNAIDSDHLDKLVMVTYVFIIPLTAITIAVSCYQSITHRKRGDSEERSE